LQVRPGGEIPEVVITIVVDHGVRLIGLRKDIFDRDRALLAPMFS
jgi:hypothetical protein